MRRILSLLTCIAGIAGMAAGHAAETRSNAFELALVDMQGQKKVLGTLADVVVTPRISPDGKHVAFEAVDAEATKELGEQTVRIHVAQLDQLDKPRMLQATVISRHNQAPVWSPDGVQIVLAALGNSADALYWERADGGLQPIYLTDGRAPEGLFDGGHKLTYLTLKGARDYGISLLDMLTQKATTLVDRPGSAQHSSSVSADGRWIAYASDETGKQEVWLEPLPITGKRFQLTKTGGNHPQWSPDGKTLYFDQGGQMFRMSVTTGTDPKAGEPAALPIKGFQQGEILRQYDLMPDGKGFVMLFPVSAAGGK